MIELSAALRSLARSAEIHAVVTRADGTTEDLGVVAYWHRNALVRWTLCLWLRFKPLWRRACAGLSSLKAKVFHG